MNIEENYNTNVDYKNRYLGIDLLKLIASFLIILIHIPSNNNFINSLTVFSRVAVPIFFMISGFFYDEKKLMKNIKKITIMIICTSCIYFMWSILKNIKDINSYIITILNVKNLTNLIFFNEFCFGYHLWYLYAYLYVLIIMLIIYKLGIKIEKLFWIIPILLSLDLILGKYSLLFFNIEFNYLYVRNFLIVGLPYFLLGKLIFEKKDKISFNNKFLIFMIILFYITSFMEREILIKNNLNATREHYFSTTLLAIFTFCLFYKNNYSKFSKISNLGKKYSTWIYFFHPILIDVINLFFRKINDYNIISAIVILLFNLIILKICEVIYLNIKGKLNIKKSTKREKNLD